MTENRKRNQTLTVRLTAAEKDAITRNAAKARMNLTDYIVASSLLTEIHVAEDTRPLLTELKRIGNNLNQISTKINAGACSPTVSRLWKLLRSGWSRRSES